MGELKTVIFAERYQIIRPLAQGGFGKTFLACDHYLPGHPQCVIKQLFLANASPEILKTAQRLFHLEAETLYKLGTHPQIPTLLAHFEHSGEFYLVQEYIPGPSLQQELVQLVQLKRPAASSLSERSHYTCTLLQDLLSILAFVHQQNVIHRDIKPANLIRRHHQLVLIDFGAVKRLTQPLTQSLTQ
ncbi:MAG: protein kinase [Phormidesmis sp. RL_2_1]|nr:protein kinase [Phormidesmis sp. RL_2_1]